MSGKTILLVEDEAAIREMVSLALERAGFTVWQAEDGAQAERLLADVMPDLMLLDWMLPGMSGIELARRLRRDEVTQDIPIIMLTARSEEDDTIRGLESGVDDYMTKPFSPRELIARINALLRRTSVTQADGTLDVGGLILDTHSHRVTAKGEAVDMGPTEFRLLHFFMAHQDRVYSRSQLLDMVWSRGSFVEERTVDVHIRRLRKALEGSGCESMVQTIRGAGYRFSVKP
ncbi:MAG: phosphate regulon transcriptional regulator PhoB [Chromatiales bacterium]|nr:phosphate regulon transcriptional regulator PhoB [Chromatiales bacterium]